MPKSVSATASLEDQRKAAKFVSALNSEARKSGTFDSAAANDFLGEVASKGDATGVQVPERLQAILDDATSDEARAHITQNLLDGVNEFTRRHGKAPGGDVILNAMQVGYSLTRDQRKAHAGSTLDSATDQHSDPLSLHPSAPAIGMMTAIAQAMPFAAYAPADIKSNEGRIIIISHRAASDAGTYLTGASLDGAANGEPFISSSRVLAVVASGAGSDHYVGNFRSKMTDHETADAGSATVKVLRGRTRVYVNGIPVARDAETGSAATSALSGTATIAGTDYTIGGTINVNTGAFDVTSTPALPGGAKFSIEAFIDFENAQEALTARFGVLAETFKLFASPDRGIITATIDSQTQFEAETGFSPLNVGSENARIQYYNERHYRALRKLYRIAEANGNTGTFDFAWATFGTQKSRAQIWQDFIAVLGARSQQMALDTVDHGITHLYVPANVAVQMSALPREIFEPSGLVAQPGIYRVGRLYGSFEVYYSPKVVTETGGGSGAKILCVGVSPTTARNPIVVGDAVAPMFMPRGVLDDMKQGYNFYTRGFTEVNPHKPSALGAALITVTNLF